MSIPREHRHNVAWLLSASVFGRIMSKDPKTRVGACVVGRDERLVSFGYNGLPSGMPENRVTWGDDVKHLHVIHAEENAIITAQFDLTGSTLYCSIKPCHRCLGVALTAGVEKVYFLETPTTPSLIDDQAYERVKALFAEVRAYKRSFVESIAKQTDTGGL